MTYPRETIKPRRLAAGLTQRKLAAQLDCKIETLRSWEHGHFCPNERNQERLDEILGKPEPPPEAQNGPVTQR